jgi:DNA polymerase-3 subunit delta
LLVAACAPADLPGSTVRRHEDVPAPSDVFDELRTIPFMGLEGRRLVVVEKGDAFVDACSEQLLGYLARPNPTSTLIICLGGSGSARRKAVRKAVEQAGLVVDCKAPSWNEAKRWLREEAGALGKKLTPRAVDALVEAIGPDLPGLHSELEKLAAHAGGEATIAERDVELLVSQVRSRSAFNLADAVGRRDAAQALRLCEELLLGGESREGIISVLAFQTRRLWQIKRERARGANEGQIARSTGVPAFAVRRALRVLPGLSDARLAGQLRILALADVDAKTSSLRAQEETVWVENLVARLCQA